VDLTGRLRAWLFLVGALAALAYGTRASGGKPPKNAVYHWNLAIGGIVEYAIVLTVVLAIAWGGGGKRLLALRPPVSWPRAAGLAVVVLIGIYVVAVPLDRVLHAGREQGLTPSGWDSTRAAAFAVNFVVIALIAPIVEELTFRGLGYSLLERYGRTFAILGVGLAFGLAHGLVEGLPILVVFGSGLAWLRSRTQSVYPGMLLHATFNSIALIVSVSG
jgi:membrane protease YdiL (CAAX protease family)